MSISAAQLPAIYTARIANGYETLTGDRTTLYGVFEDGTDRLIASCPSAEDAEHIKMLLAYERVRITTLHREA